MMQPDGSARQRLVTTAGIQASPEHAGGLVKTKLGIHTWISMQLLGMLTLCHISPHPLLCEPAAGYTSPASLR